MGLPLAAARAKARATRLRGLDPCAHSAPLTLVPATTPLTLVPAAAAPARYLLAELGTSGSLDGQQRLIVKGRFLPKSFETVLRRYVNEWVARARARGALWAAWAAARGVCMCACGLLRGGARSAMRGGAAAQRVHAHGPRHAARAAAPFHQLPCAPLPPPPPPHTRTRARRYVLCPGCKSVDTLLDKDSATRLMHLRCQQCGASRTVSAIKSGFVARVTRRQQT